MLSDKKIVSDNIFDLTDDADEALADVEVNGQSNRK
jgi:hypothetical protein